MRHFSHMSNPSIYILAATLVGSAIPPQANALLLDCDINANKTYTCIEISAPESAGKPIDQDTYGEEYNSYVNQARQSCVYEKPRKRATGKGYSGAQRSEEIKTARKNYDDCVRDKARTLWHQNNSPN